MDRRIGRRTIGPLVSFLALAFLLFSFYGTATPTSFSDGDGTTPNILIIYNTSGSLAGSGAPPGTSAENMNITLSDAGGNVTIWNITAEGRLPTLAEANFYNATIYTQGTRNQTLNDETMAFLDAYLYGDVGHLIIEGQNVLNDAGLIEGNTTFVERVLRCDSSDIINITDVGVYTNLGVSDSTHPITYGLTSNTSTTYSIGLQDDIQAIPPAKIVIDGATDTRSGLGAVNTWENTTTEHRMVYMAFPWNENSTYDTIDDQTFRDELLINCVNWVRDFNKPTANITHPAQDAQLSGTATVNGTASDIDDGTGVRKVELTWDNGLNWHLVDGNTSWTYQWHTAAVPSANYTLIARATDYAGNYNDSVGVNVTVYNAGGEAKPYGPPSIIVTVNRYIILDDPVAGTESTGYRNPNNIGYAKWDGESTTIRVHVLAINNTGLADVNLNVTFKLKKPNATVLDTQYILTDSNGLAKYSYDLNAQNHWGVWTVTVNATQFNKTGSETNTIENTTFIYNWWGCGDCHSSSWKKVEDWVTPVTPNSPYTKGYDKMHTVAWRHDLDDNNCLKCHKSYGTGSAGYQTPAGRHSQNSSNQQYCQDCHGTGTYIRSQPTGIPDMPSCYAASCHPQYNTHPAEMHTLNDSMTDSRDPPQPRMFYSGDPYDPSKPMTAHEPSPRTSVPCISCHGIGHKIHSFYPDGAGNNVTELELCICCHTGYVNHNNVISCTEECHCQDAHNMSYLNFTGNLTSDRTQAVNCTSCHQTSALPAIHHGVDVRKPLNHSNNNSGQRWGDYWTDDLGSCLYCHGDTMHTGLSLGWVRRFQGNNVPNSAIDIEESNWCASCHWVGYKSGDANYTTMTDTFEEAGLPLPPEITNGTDWNGIDSGYYNHTLGNYNDEGCKDCHYDPFTTDKMTEFTHNVSEGIEADYDCVRCHDLGKNAPEHVDVTVLKTSTHVDLNKNAVNVSRLTDDIDKACWGCHGEDDNEDGLANETEQPTGVHPTNYETPRNCLDCHNNTAASNFSAKQTYGHTWYSTKITTPAVTWCTDCHAKSEMIMPNSDPDEGTINATSSHYERKRTDLKALIGTDAYCNYCHQNSTTVFPFAVEDNKTRSDHARQNSPQCTNSSCHGPYELHEEGLQNPRWFTDTNCTECHSEKFHNGTVTCTDCHLGTPADIHPTHYLQHDGVTYSTAKEVAADCHDCHESTKADATIGETSPQVPTQHHSDDVTNGTKWGNYWKYTKQATTFVTSYANTTGTVANFTNAQSTATNYTTIAEENVSGVYRYNVTFDFTDVVDYVNKTLELDYKIHGESCTMFVYNGTAWNERATLYKGAFTPTTYELTSDEYVNGNVSVRFIDESQASDTVASSIDVKYFYVHSDTGLLYPCGYCHHPNMHYEDALGMPSSYKGNNIENQSITAGNWCAGCHYQSYTSGAATYDDTVVAFQNAGLSVPPEITGNATYGANQSNPDYYNHSGIAGFNDSDCHGCHGSLVSIDAGTTNFVHNVCEGKFGPDCISCHDVGRDVARVNVTAMNQSDSIHANVNSAANDTTGNLDNKMCWGCHQSDGSQPAADQHPDKVSDPYTCWECHNGTSKPYVNVSDALNVTEHFRSGENITAVSSADNNTWSCLGCHNKDEMMVSYTEPDAIDTTLSLTSHYGKKRTDLSDQVNTDPYCNYCHNNVSTVFPFAVAHKKGIFEHTANSTADVTNATTLSCNNTNCHATGRIHNDTLTVPSVSAWTSGKSDYCAPCHSPTDAISNLNISNEAHNTTQATISDCGYCHNADVLATGNAYQNLHSDNLTKADATHDNCSECHVDTAWVQREISEHTDNTSADISRSYLTCDNSSCHASSQPHSSSLNNGSTLSSGWSGASNSVCAPCHEQGGTSINVYTHNVTWTGIDDCAQCHNSETHGQPDAYQDIHSTNLTAGGNASFNDCYECHQDTGLAFVSKTILEHTNDTSADVNASYLTCGNSSCHADETNLHTNTLVVPSTSEWTSGKNDMCKPCHEPNDTNASKYVYNQGHDPTYSDRITSCGFCHNASTPASDPLSFKLHDEDVRATISGAENCTKCHNGTTTYVGSSRQILTHFPGAPTGKANTSQDSYECEDCHNLTVGASMHSLGMNVTYWNCSACHLIPDLNSPYNSTTTRIDVYQHNNASYTAAGTADCFQCHNNTNALQPFHFTAHPRGTVAAPGWSGWVNGTKVNCTSCHVEHAEGNPFNAQPTSWHKEDYGSALNECYYCHTNVTSSEDSYAPIAMHNVTTTVNWYDCVNCHVDGKGGAPIVDNSSMGMHQNLNGANASDENPACKACHGGGGAGGSAEHHNTTPYYCRDCHATTIRYNAPGVVEHIPLGWNASTELVTNTTDECWLCHNNSLTSYSDSSPGTVNALVSHYGTNVSLMTSAINTTNCTWCHFDNSGNASWQYPVDPRVKFPSVHDGKTNVDCYSSSCHVKTGVTPESFHNETLFMGGGADCISCHDVGQTESTLHVNVSVMNSTSAVHNMLNNGTGTSLNPDNERCWACHGDGSEPEGHSINFDNPWNCSYCHVTPIDYSAPDVSEHIQMPSNSINVTTTANCTTCHNNSILDFNTTDSRTLTQNETISHYGTNGSLFDTMGDVVTTEGCIYCHLNATNAEKWGNATDPSVSTARPHVETDNKDCYACHIEGGQPVLDFHHWTLYRIYPASPPASPTMEPDVKLTTNRIVILDDPYTGQNGTGFSLPEFNWSTLDCWNNESTTIRAYALILNNTGLAAANVNVTFTLKNPGDEIIDTQYNTTGSDGVAQYSFDLNTQNYYGNWTLNSSCTVDGVLITSNFTFIYSWWGCGNCHHIGDPDSSILGTATSRSPYMMGYDSIHSNTSIPQHTDRVDDSECLFCHQSYGNNLTAGNQTPAGFHNGTYCQGCHARGNGTWLAEGGNGNGTPDILSCYNSSCHSRTDISNKTTLNGNYSRYSGDPSTPLTYHDSGSSVPCVICHQPMHMITSPYPSGKDSTTTEDQHCTKCHLDKKHSPNNPVNCTQCHSEDVHVIKFITNSTTQTTPDYNTSRLYAAICTDCHNVSGINDYFVNQSYSPSTNDTYGYNLTRHDNVVRCETCHDRLHWIGYLNSTGKYQAQQAGAVNCTDCHYGPTENANVSGAVSSWGNYTAPVKRKHNDTVDCTDCHNSSKHGIRYLQHDMIAFGEDAAGKSTAVNCTDCHQVPGYTSAPKIPAPMYHSNNASSGSIWGSYWTNESDSCNYCHDDTKHDNVALGKPKNFMGNNTVNQSLLGGTWCASCHYKNYQSGNKTYTDMTNTMSPVPPEITNGTNWNGIDDNYYNHSLSYYSDEGCKDCHYDPYTSDRMTKFMHNVSIGIKADPNCVRCHDVGGVAPALIDVSVMNSTGAIHNNLNSDADATVDADNKRCWACHGDGDGTQAAQPAAEHPSNYTSPKNCSDCHITQNFNALVVYEHYSNGTDIKTNASLGTNESCVSCHNESEMKLDYSSDPGGPKSNYAAVSHYSKNRTELRTGPDGSINCSYCHQNVSTAFTVAMVDASYNSSIFNHSAMATNPDCTNSTCHETGWIHNASLTRPQLTMPNSSYCQNCHDRQKHNNTVDCTRCHVNVSVKDTIHPISYLQEDGGHLNSTVAKASREDVNCTGCHQKTWTFTPTPPKVSDPMHHSDDPLNGSKWNASGYWINTSQVTMCEYCHNDTTHDATAMGPHLTIIKYNDTRNGTMTTTNMWCAGCHYQGDDNYTETVSSFEDVGKIVPPEITGGTYAPGTAADGTSYYDHSFSDFSAAKCDDCHGDSPATTVEFVHNVCEGKFGPDCIYCHDVGRSASRVNVTAMNQSDSIHANVNSAANDTTGNLDNKMCWGCHQSDGSQPAADQHPDKVSDPYTCWECHNGTSKPYVNVSDALNVTEHFTSGADIYAATADNETWSCLACHNKSEMMMSYEEPDMTNTTLSLVSHYGRNRTELRTGPDGSTNCSYCHQNASTAFTSAMLNPSYNASIVNHSARTTNPDCTNSTCHETGWIHNASLQRPSLPTPNSTYCQECHGPSGWASTKDKEMHNASVNCTTCHVNTSSSDTIHPIKYLLQNNTYGTLNTTAVNCTTCHQKSDVNDKFDPDPPKVLDPMHHSDDELNGSKWNTTPGYWNISDEVYSPCLYCHNDTTHNATAIGPHVSVIAYGDVSNTTYFIGSRWCAGCHYQGDDNYTEMVASFADIGLKVPIEITGNKTYSTWNASADVYDPAVDDTPYYNHSGLGMDVASCKGCHGGLLSASPTTAEFVHNVGMGAGPDCIACHDVGQDAPKRVNVTDMNVSVHADLNENASATVDSANKKCWGCHQTDGAQPDENEHPDRIRDPYTCWECHNGTSAYANVSSALGVFEHFVNGTDIKTKTGAPGSAPDNTTSCLECHNLTELKVSYVEDDPYGSNLSFVSHYPVNYTPLVELRSTINSTEYCRYCHDNYTVFLADFIRSSCQNITHGENCSACHGAGMIHDGGLKAGEAGPDCIYCHDVGRSAERVNVSAMNQSGASIHADLNSNATNTTGVPADNKICWGCHQSDGSQPAADQHPDKVSDPYTCWECHNGTSKPYVNVSDALNVTEHFKSGENITAVSSADNDTWSCLECHNKSEMMMSYTEPDTTNTTLSLISHYGRKRTDLRTGPGGSVNCSYCHQNTSSVFKSVMVNEGNASIVNHTDQNNPDCTNSTCHDVGWIHNSTLKRPTTVDYTLCTDCHGGKSRHNDTLDCTECHGNATNKIHPILYLNYDNTTSPWDSTNAVNCTSCHQSTAVDGSLSLTPPRVNAPMHHSDDELNGSKWNATPGYWNISDEVYSPCLYCHNDTTHNATAIGPHVSVIAYGDVSNTTTFIGSMWCAGCHYQNDDNYTETVSSFKDVGKIVPPEITGNETYKSGTAADGTAYYDHSGLGMDVASCKGCHGGLLSASPTTAEFVHNVGEGAAGPDCVLCHDIGKTAPVLVDVSAMNTANSMHKGLNKDANTTLNPDNKRCWACHGDGSEPTGHPSNYDNPRACEDCHVGYVRFNATKVSEHYVGGEDIKAYKPCWACHKIGYNTYLLEIRFNKSISASEINEKVSHYGEPLSETCISCHQNTTAEDYGVTKLAYKHANNSCTVCHASDSVRSLHDENLTIPLLTCKDCHTSEYRMFLYNGPGQIKSHYPMASSGRGNTLLDGYTCEYCHGLSTTQKLHSDSLTITKWDCVDCHSSTGSGPTARYVTKIDTYAHYESYVSCGYNCHAADQGFHYSTYALGDVVDPGWSGWTIGTPVSCPDCHVTHAGETPFNAPPDHGTMRPSCEDCHRSPEADTWIKFVHNVITAAGPDCGRCHETMVVVIGGSVHVELNVEAPNETVLTDPAAKACWACHGNGTEPLGHPPEYKTPLDCISCHVTCGEEEPYYPPDISELTKGQASLEECLICHNETHVALAGRKMGALTKEVVLSPSLAIWGDRVALNTKIDEYFLTVKKAEYFIDVVGEPGTGIPMNATDGAFDDAREDAWAVIDTYELTIGDHIIYVHAMDSAGTWGPSSSTILTVRGKTFIESCTSAWRSLVGMFYQTYLQILHRAYWIYEWIHVQRAHFIVYKEPLLNIYPEPMTTILRHVLT